MEDNKESNFKSADQTRDPILENQDITREEVETDGHSEQESVNEIPFEIISGNEVASDSLLKSDLTQIEKGVDQLVSQFENLSEEFQSKLKYDKHKEKIIDNLHAELQIHKNGLMGKLLRPVFMDIIEVIDDTRRLMKDLNEKNAEDSASKVMKYFSQIPEDLEDLLYKHGVDVVRSTEDSFNPSSQKVVKTLPTKDPQLDKKIAKRLKNGYSWEGKLIRHEVVNVWQYKEE